MPGSAATFKEWKAGTLHSGSKHGPLVHSRAQAIAIALNQGRKAGESIAPKDSYASKVMKAAKRRG